MKNSEHIYRKFIEFEERAASVYLQMATGFNPENAELSALWLDMAMIEKQLDTALKLLDNMQVSKNFYR